MPHRLTHAAKSLRRRMTATEHRLWQRLRAGRFAGFKFKRQQPLGPYIADFVCFKARVVVELDGGQHLNSESDRVRDEWMNAQGFRVLRFWDNDVWRNMEGVQECILQCICTPLPRPLSRKGRGE